MEFVIAKHIKLLNCGNENERSTHLCDLFVLVYLNSPILIVLPEGPNGLYGTVRKKVQQ